MIQFIDIWWTLISDAFFGFSPQVPGTGKPAAGEHQALRGVWERRQGGRVLTGRFGGRKWGKARKERLCSACFFFCFLTCFFFFFQMILKEWFDAKQIDDKSTNILIFINYKNVLWVLTTIKGPNMFWWLIPASCGKKSVMFFWRMMRKRTHFTTFRNHQQGLWDRHHMIWYDMIWCVYVYIYIHICIICIYIYIYTYT